MTDSERPTASDASAGARAAHSLRRTAFACVIVLLAFGALQTLWNRRALNPDGVSYLDLSDVVLAGRWGAMVQAYWGPLYVVLLAAARRVAGQGVLHETFIAHGVNFAGFAFSLFGWHLLLAQLVRRRAGLVPFGTPLGIVAGYAVFAWAMLWISTHQFITPDLLLGGWIFTSAAFVLRHDQTVRARHTVALGAALGAGFLTKAVLLPVAPFFILGAALLVPSEMRTRVALRAVVALALVAGPWIVAISVHSGRLTYGDNGRFNYGWLVTGDRWFSPDPQHETGPGSAVFPRVFATPAVYAWPEAEGTYAPWRDPSAWHGNMPVRVDMARQVRVLNRSAHFLSSWMVSWGILLVVVVLAGPVIRSAGVRAGFALGVPSIVAITGYALVFVEGRYVAPFLALLVVAVLTALRSVRADVGRLALAAAAGTALWIIVDIRRIPGAIELVLGLLLYLLLVARGACPRALATIAGAASIAIGGTHVVLQSVGDAARLAAGEVMIDDALRARTALVSERFPEGRRIAIIGDGTGCAVWAREIRARIVSELPASQAAAFWGASDEVRAAVAHTMRAAGAQEIIASGALPDTLPPGWHRVPEVQMARYALDAP